MTEQDIMQSLNSIFKNFEIVDVNNQEIKYHDITLINPKTKKAYTAEDLISELLGIIDYKKFNSISKEDLQNIAKLFLELQASITKLYSINNK